MADPPKLFNLSNPVPSAIASPLSFSTPLGRLDLELQVGGVTVAPTATFTAGSRSVTVWSAPVRFELLLTCAPISLPPGMAVAGALAAVWRVDSAQSAIIRCRWASDATWSEVGSETGENLDAQTWTDGLRLRWGCPTTRPPPLIGVRASKSPSVRSRGNRAISSARGGLTPPTISRRGSPSIGGRND
jgi:hypothetical protein